MLPLIAGVVLLDRITKLLITQTMEPGMSFPVIPGLVSCTYVLNPGAAFGLLEHKRLFFVVITLVALVAIFLLRDHIRREGPKARLGTALFPGRGPGQPDRPDCHRACNRFHRFSFLARVQRGGYLYLWRSGTDHGHDDERIREEAGLGEKPENA